jgi:hypothetical protein
LPSWILATVLVIGIIQVLEFHEFVRIVAHLQQLANNLGNLLPSPTH